MTGRADIGRGDCLVVNFHHRHVNQFSVGNRRARGPAVQAVYGFQRRLMTVRCHSGLPVLRSRLINTRSCFSGRQESGKPDRHKSRTNGLRGWPFSMRYFQWHSISPARSFPCWNHPRGPRSLPISACSCGRNEKKSNGAHAGKCRFGLKPDKFYSAHANPLGA